MGRAGAGGGEPAQARSGRGYLVDASGAGADGARAGGVDTFIAPKFSPQAYIDTSKGTIQFELAVLDAPRTVANFIALVRKNYFRGVQLHRVVPDFVVQDGDPRGDGEGGPGYTIRDEINQRPYLRGTVGMALDWADTGGSQFFITHSPQPHLDGRYTVFGQVVSGMDVVDRLQQWDTIERIRVWDGVNWIGSKQSRDRDQQYKKGSALTLPFKLLADEA